MSATERSCTAPPAVASFLSESAEGSLIERRVTWLRLGVTWLRLGVVRPKVSG